MTVNQNIFRSYDIRGIYPEELNEETARKITIAFAKRYPKAKKIIVARDPRLSSPSIAKNIINELIGADREVIDIGIAPDPLFYFSLIHYRYDGGIMVSGSHNPKNHNGLTLFVKKAGERVGSDVINKDLETIKRDVLSLGALSTPKRKGKKTTINPQEDYINYVTKRIHLNKPLKIIIDTGNGAMGSLPEKVFRRLGCRVKTIFKKFDGNYPNHMPDPYLEDNLKDLQKEVLLNKADLGFAYDSDGDRVSMIDETGRTVNGDFCLMMLAIQAVEKKKGPIVHCMRASKALIDEMNKRGVKTYFSISHHNAVIKKIIKTKAVFGGEITMHFLFPTDYYLCDDALFASLKLAEIGSSKNKISEYVDSLPRYFSSPEIFIDSNDEIKFKIIADLQNYLKKHRYNFIAIDGARINFEHGWALARAANTTPIIKCRFEGDTLEHLKEIEVKALNIFKKVGIPINKETYKQLGL